MEQQAKIRGYCGQIFKESCLHHSILDQAVPLERQTMFQADKSAGLHSGVSRGGLCVYIIDAWYSQTKLADSV